MAGSDLKQLQKKKDKIVIEEQISNAVQIHWYVQTAFCGIYSVCDHKLHHCLMGWHIRDGTCSVHIQREGVGWQTEGGALVGHE